jgi:hypothetical protein
MAKRAREMAVKERRERKREKREAAAAARNAPAPEMLPTENVGD